jgi:hypothetical protein
MAAEPQYAPTPLQTLFLWALICRGGEALQKDLKPTLEKSDRAALVRLGLLLELTDRGWAWAAANTAARLPTTGTAALPVLADLLARLGGFLAARDVPLAEFVRPAPRLTTPPEPVRLVERIRTAYFQVTGQAVNRRARLSDIRSALADIPRADQDQALREMMRAGGAGLLPLDDPTEITDAEHEAALMVGDQPRHILWLDR